MIAAARMVNVQAPVALLEMDLVDEAIVINVQDTCAAALVLVRLHGVPLGMIGLDCRAGRWSAEGLRDAIRRELTDAIVGYLAHRAVESPPGEVDPIGTLLARPYASQRALARSGPTISVAVCTRDRPESLAPCLHAISALCPAPHEVLVIDNAPATDATARLVTEMFPAVRYVREMLPGLDRARNRAIAEAHGDVIAFTDDDVEVDAAWLAPVGTLFAHNPELVAVTGLVLPRELATEAQWLFERYGGFARGFERRWHYAPHACHSAIALQHGNTGKLGTGANMAFRRIYTGVSKILFPRRTSAAGAASICKYPRPRIHQPAELSLTVKYISVRARRTDLKSGTSPYPAFAMAPATANSEKAPLFAIFKSNRSRAAVT